MRRMLIFITAMLVASSAALAAQDAEKIGRAVVVENTVDLLTANGAFEIVIGTEIATRQTVTTGDKSSSQFTMRDDTRLAVGPNSQLLLDEFVFDPNPDKTKLVLKGLKGALRFVTGKNPSETYTINTPTAVIGVRGTMFDIYINDQGDTVIGLLAGKVNVCPPGSANCQDLQTAGRFLSIDRQGRIRKADRPDRAMLGNVNFARAFPFLGGARRLRGKLAAPRKLRQRIRKKAGLRSAPNRKIKRKALKRKALKRKATKRRATRKRIRPQPPAGHRKVINARPTKPKHLSPQRKKKRKRKKKVFKLRGEIYIPIPLLGGIFKKRRKKRPRLQ